MKKKNVTQVKVLSGSTSSEQEVRGSMLDQLHQARGSIVAFDELSCPEFPGEAKVVMEVLGLRNIAV
ncbi:hypothetical protein OAG92_04870 [Akkermansiaceae bacterium]|nr:hypothetical protein [bacterium]MDB4801561.1 hypothetical protein [Akkermansiaceae bacterium]